MKERHEQTARGKRFGLRPVGDHHCPHWLFNKHCPVICEGHQAFYSEIFDHARSWKDKDGEKVLTGEPYHYNEKAINRCAEWFADQGMPITIEHFSSPHSFWFPGPETHIHTHLLVIRRAG